VEDISAAHPSQIVAIVAHGTVISLYLSGLLGWEATETFRFWKGLGLPGGVSIGDQNLEVIF
jgi:broad specificity phosphatase PhoE